MTGSGRPRSSQAARSVTRRPPASRAKPSATELRREAAWGHERLGRYLWGAGHIEESAAEFATAAALLADNARPEAAAVFAGFGQAELMLGHYDIAEARAQRVFELLTTPEADPLAWAMARRVLGIVVDHAGDPSRGVVLCREAVEAAPSAQTRLLAVLYLGVALLDAGRYQEAVNEMLDAAAEARLTGLDRSFGGYLDALAAEGLLRLGRWSEAATVLRSTEGAEAFPLGEIRLALAGAMLASRRGEGDRARAARAGRGATCRSLSSVVPRSSRGRGLSRPRRLGRGRGRCRAGPDRCGHRAVAGTVRHVRRRCRGRARARCPRDASRSMPTSSRRAFAGESTARDAAEAGRGEEEALDTAAHLAHAAAAVTRLGDSDPEVWAEAARHWARLADPYWLATARVREAEAAAAVGATARAAEALQEAHQLAAGLGAVPLLADIEAVSRRTRLSVEAPVAVVLGAAAIDHLGLTPREAEVLSLVATGQTNRQIGEALFVSEKTASVHVSNILRKLGVSSRVDAAAVAQRLGVT